MNPVEITFIVALLFGSVIAAGFYFYRSGWDASFQDQIKKLEQRQALGEITVRSADIIKVHARTIIPRMPDSVYKERKEWIVNHLAMDIGEKMLKDGLLELYVGSYPTEDSFMFGEPDNRVLQLKARVLKY